MMHTKKCVIYCRVSSDRQVREGHGLDGQEMNCRRWAEFNNCKVLGVYRDEGISGSVVNRVGMQALIEFVRQQSDEIIVVFDDISRFARDVRAHLDLRLAIEKAGGRIENVAVKLEDTPEGRLLEMNMASFSEYHRIKNTEQVVSRQKARLSAGYWVFHPPTGYRFEKVEGHGKMLVRHEPDASIVAEAFLGYASGRFGTLEDVYQFMLSRSFKGGKKFSYQTVANTFNNVLYAGQVERLSWDISRRKGQHEAIIDLDTFNRVQEIMHGKRKAVSTRNLHEDFPLRGYVDCACCGSPLTASWSRGSTTKVPYYRCRKKAVQCECGGKSIPRDKLHDAFVEKLEGADPSPQVMSLMKAITERLYGQRVEIYHDQVEVRQKRVRSIEKEIDRCVDAFVKTSSSAMQARLNQKIDELESEKEDAQNAVAEVNESFVDVGTALDRAFEFMKSPMEAWIYGDYETKLRLQRLVFSKPMAYDKKTGVGTVEYRLPFKLMRDNCVDESKMVVDTGFEPVTPTMSR